MAKHRSYVACLAVAMLALIGCQVNPATGQRNFNVLGENQEIRIGSEAVPQFLGEQGGELPSPVVQAYVRDLGQRLATQSERANLPWEFHVLDSATVNAFALPGGKVFITRGLLAKLSSEAELAGVLGHEIGHVTAQHQGQQMTRAMVLTGILVGIGVAAETSDEDWLRVLGVGAGVGGTLYTLSFSRSQELEADALGVRYMTRLGYNPVAQIRVMEVLAGEGSGGSIEFLSTHPHPESRIDDLRRLIATEYPQYEDPSRYAFKADAFKTAVLDNLAKLPAPRHGAPAAGGSALRR